MDLNSLKSFARSARKELIKTVSFKIQNVLSEETKQTNTDNQTSVTGEAVNDEAEDSKTDDESIESIPFIAEPSKDKRSRSVK